MYGLKDMLLQEQKRLEGILTKVRAKSAIAAEGKLRISVDEGKVRYYHCVQDGDGTYIPRENLTLPRELAQKNYDDMVVKKAESSLRLIKKCIDQYSDDEIEKVYKSMHQARKALVTPVELTAEQMEEKWFAEEYKGKEFQEGTPVILSERGERVRSKSEKILADFFYRNNVLYKYEKPLYLNGYGTIYPDFTFFSKKLKQEIYWEHEGMMDVSEYARTAVKKLNCYQLNGIFPGERLIVTYETEQDVLSTKIMAKLLDKILN